MGVQEGRGQLAKLMKELNMQWLDVRHSWDDVRMHEFEQRYLLPLDIDLRKAVGAMDLMAAYLSQVRRDCE